jgi:ATP-binding cassette, subfamily B, bacterial MsbA
MARWVAIRGVRQILSAGAPYAPLLARAFACMVVVALSTGAYAYVLGPLLRFVLRGGQPLPGWVGQRLDAWGWWGVPALLVALGAVKGVGYLGQFYWLGLYGQAVTASLRKRFFDAVASWSLAARGPWATGEVQARFTADLTAVEQAATYTVASWLRDSIQIAVLAGVAFVVSWKLALMAMVAVLLAILPAARFSRALMRRSRESQTAVGQLTARVSEGLGALPTVQVFGAQHVELERFGRVTKGLEDSASSAGWSRAATPALMEVFASLAIAATLGWAVATEAVSADALVSFLTTLVLLYQPAKDLGRVAAFGVAAAAAFERLEPFLAAAPAETVAAQSLRETLSLDEVGFSWSPGAPETLRGVSFSIRVGHTTALIGPSGAGKSSALAILLGLAQPQRGSVSIDGVPTSAQARRGLFALVTQEPVLLSASVAENLRLALPNATQRQMENACRLANAHDFVAALPQGYQTVLGERGRVLSGGQRQRLCLARALLSPAPVLVLDEPTSQLDPRGEAEVLAALQSAVVGRTVVLVTHHPELMPGLKTIVELRDGRVS